MEEIKPTAKEDPQRFMDLSDGIIKQLERDDVICLEGFSYGSKGQGVSTQYGIGWIIRVGLIKSGFTYTEIAPSALKKFASGKGNTKKDELVLPIYKRWNFEHSSDNVHDAFVLARIAQALHDDVELTAFQEEVLKKAAQ